jgi:hypothetical protein
MMLCHRVNLLNEKENDENSVAIKEKALPPCDSGAFSATYPEWPAVFRDVPDA